MAGLDAVREGCGYSTTVSRLYPIIRFGLLLISVTYEPVKFAAIAPMSAPMVTTAWASRLKDTPIWAFHGEKDDIVPVSDTRALIDTLKAFGGDVRFTVFANRDHYILDTYENQELYSCS